MKERDVLDAVAWGEKHFGSVVTSRQLPRRDVLREVAHGSVKSVGMVILCDDDGHTAHNPERYREGFALTEKGKLRLRALARIDALLREGNGT